MADKRAKVKHIGILWALCSPRVSAHLRDDLSVERYRQLGVKERFKDEAPYRICKRCIAAVDQPYDVQQAREKRQRAFIMESNR